jgi:hypothetical protein
MQLIIERAQQRDSNHNNVFKATIFSSVPTCHARDYISSVLKCLKASLLREVKQLQSFPLCEKLTSLWRREHEVSLTFVTEISLKRARPVSFAASCFVNALKRSAFVRARKFIPPKIKIHTKKMLGRGSVDYGASQGRSLRDLIEFIELP